ncbi:ETX/MTX2 family pore-forming toxin [Pseudomonas sp. QD4]|uniref:ETX/MTX2 family pore-forming toxin n=1 Tax=Pseudomonas sp. QD4 TaxID=3368618 RepID=UPI003B9EFCCF
MDTKEKLTTTKNSQNIDNLLETMLRNYATKTQRPGTANDPLVYTGHRVNEYNLSGENIATSIVGSEEILTTSFNDLKNSLPHEVSLPVPGFNYTETSETSTTNSAGWTFSYGIESSVSVDVLFASASLTHNFSVEYNMSTEETVTRTTQRSWTIEPFSVPVPAHRTYRINYMLQRVAVSGRNRVSAELIGIANYRNKNNNVIVDSKLGDVARVMSDWGQNPSQSEGFLDGGWPVNAAINSGEVRFSTRHAVSFFVEIYDITAIKDLKESGILVERLSPPGKVIEL